MKRLGICFFIMAWTLTACHKDILSDIENLESRVTNLEELCDNMNANLEAVQTLLGARQSGDMISSVSAITLSGDTTGYVITFTNGKSVTIHNGQDGAQGNDGYTPDISVSQHSDGIYYWTLDGNWLQDTDGAMLPVTGAKGEQGETGEQGEAGVDGVTPKLKIMYGYWYIFYEGDTRGWIELGAASGTDGTDGTNGTDGAKGDKGDPGLSVFYKVEQDDKLVYFTLADKTTVITLAKCSQKDSHTITYYSNPPSGTGKVLKVEKASLLRAYTIMKCGSSVSSLKFLAWNTEADGTGLPFLEGETIHPEDDLTLYAQWTGEFSVSASQKVAFAPGNLQYKASAKLWRFAENQYDRVGTGNSGISSSYNGWIDLFGFGTGYNATATSTQNADYTTFTDWGVNVIDGYPDSTWRTLTGAEWDYLFRYRANAASRYGFATVNGQAGVILLPDSWTSPSGISFTAGTAAYGKNTYTTQQWTKMERAGAIFLPATGYRTSKSALSVNEGYYWSSQASNASADKALVSHFSDGTLHPATTGYRCFGSAVRLVKDF